jgi:hypothetical protein
MGGFIGEDPTAFAGGQLSFYAYVGGNPISYNDPSGLLLAPAAGSALANAIARAAAVDAMGGGPEDPLGDAAAAGTFIGTLIGAAIDGAMDSIEYRANYREYKRICSEKAPNGLNDPCERAKWELNKALRCKAARQAFTDKWYQGVDAAHDPQLYNDINNQIANAQNAVKRWCNCK